MRQLTLTGKSAPANAYSSSTKKTKKPTVECVYQVYTQTPSCLSNPNSRNSSLRRRRTIRTAPTRSERACGGSGFIPRGTRGDYVRLRVLFLPLLHSTSLPRRHVMLTTHPKIPGQVQDPSGVGNDDFDKGLKKSKFGYRRWGFIS